METLTLCDREHDFALVLTGVSALGPSVMDALFEAGCDDATVSLRFATVYLSFSRTAPSLKEAILSAIQDVKRANLGARVVRVDGGNLITQAEIARKVGRSRQLVHQYINGVRGGGGFPAPVGNVASKNPLWAWCEVAQWLRTNSMIKEQELVDALELENINSCLDYLNHQQSNPLLTQEIFNTLSH